MDQYMKPIKDDEDLADGIALTRALKENFFAFIVGMQCNIPASKLRFRHALVQLIQNDILYVFQVQDIEDLPPNVNPFSLLAGSFLVPALGDDRGNARNWQDSGRKQSNQRFEGHQFGAILSTLQLLA